MRAKLLRMVYAWATAPVLHLLAVLAACAWPCSTAAVGYAPVDELYLQGLLSSMSLPEKINQTCNPRGAVDPDNMYTLPNLERLKVQGLYTRDGPRGVTCWSMIRRQSGGDPFGLGCPTDGTSPAFPSASLRGATWDTDLEEKFGQTARKVAERIGVNTVLLPSLNHMVWLSGGRAQEEYGEDPFLVGKMGAAAIRGVQATGTTAACAKHAVANDIENTRFWVDAQMDDKTLHETFLKAWAIGIKDSAPEYIMMAYNRVQGDFPYTNPKVLDLLRNKYGFKGSAMTDWMATSGLLTSGMAMGELGKRSPFYHNMSFITNPGEVLHSGVDLEMPFCNQNKKVYEKLQKALNTEVWTEQDGANWMALDEAVTRILRSKQRYGLIGKAFDPPPKADLQDDSMDDQALVLAQRGIVLLENNGLLPKEPSTVQSVVVLGAADHLQQGDHGSSWAHPSQATVTVLQGLQDKYGVHNVHFFKTHDNATSIKPNWETWDLVAGAKTADLVVISLGLDNTVEGEYIPLGKEGGDRRYVSLLPRDIDLIQRVATYSSNIVVAITAGSAITVEEFRTNVSAILWMGYPGPKGGQALSNILAGDVNPSGRMTVVTPKRWQDFLPPSSPINPGISAEPSVTYPTVAGGTGYKYMWGAGIEPRYPFGWGMSYTTFTIQEPTLERSPDSGIVSVLTAVKNTGSRAGVETLQVYSSCVGTCWRGRSPISLMGFKQVQLEPGQSSTVEIKFAVADLGIFEPQRQTWMVEPGHYRIYVGSAAKAELLQSTDYFVAKEVFFNYPEDVAVGAWLPYPAAPKTSSAKSLLWLYCLLGSLLALVVSTALTVLLCYNKKKLRCCDADKHTCCTEESDCPDSAQGEEDPEEA